MATNDTAGLGRTGNQLPKQFGRYEILKPLGDGGMGCVYLVLNTHLRREEALKVPHFEARGDAEIRERFQREARAAAGLDHPNLCQVYDVGECDGICYLTMRYLDGQPLSDFTGTPQPPRKAVEIVAKLAQALASAHAKGVTHRDLKPGNVMMCASVGPVVMDFGLAKQTDQQGRKLTRMGAILGTPAYMPPEQIKGDLTKLGPTSDVYSLGVILFELLTGRLPFAATTEEEMYAAVLFNPAPAPSSLRRGLSPLLDAVCRRALAKAPADRYPSMKDLAADLFQYLKATPPTPGGDELIKGGATGVFQMATVAPVARGHEPSARIETANNLHMPTVSPVLSQPLPAPLKSTPPSAPAPQRGAALNVTLQGVKAPAPQGRAPLNVTLQGIKAPSSIRPPAAAQPNVAPAPLIVPRAAARKGGRRSVGAFIGKMVCLLLLVGGASAVGVLIYTLNQKKADESKEVALAPPTQQPAQPITPPDDPPVVRKDPKPPLPNKDKTAPQSKDKRTSPTDEDTPPPTDKDKSTQHGGTDKAPPIDKDKTPIIDKEEQARLAAEKEKLEAEEKAREEARLAAVQQQLEEEQKAREERQARAEKEAEARKIREAKAVEEKKIRDEKAAADFRKSEAERRKDLEARGLPFYPLPTTVYQGKNAEEWHQYINDPAGITETGVAALVALKEEGTPYLLDLLDSHPIDRIHSLYLRSIKPEYIHRHDLPKIISALNNQYSEAARLLALRYLSKIEESRAFFDKISSAVKDLKASALYGRETKELLNAIEEAK